MDILVFLIILSIIKWSISPFIHKELYNNIKYDNIICFKYIILSIIFISYTIYDYKNKKIAFNELCQNNKLLTYFILSIIFSIVGGFTYYTLLKKYDVSFIIPILKSMSLIIIIIAGYLLFNEKISNNKFLGILLISLGMYLINTN